MFFANLILAAASTKLLDIKSVFLESNATTVSPSDFLDKISTLSNQPKLSRVYVFVFPGTSQTRIERVLKFLPGLAGLDKLVAGRIVPSRKLFRSDCPFDAQSSVTCTAAARFCKTNGASVGACYEALAICTDPDCFFQEAQNKIVFEQQTYRTPTSYDSVSEKFGVIAMSRRVLKFLARNAQFFTKDLPSLELALGLWLAPMGDVDWAELSEL